MQRIRQTKIRHGLKFLMLAALTGCIGQTVDDVAILDAGRPDLAVSQDGSIKDATPDAESDAGSSQPDLSGTHCKGTETFQAAQAAMLGSCGGFGPRGCHSRAPFGGNLDLTSANAYASLVNVHADIAPNKLRVKPGDPDGSFLFQKLTNKQAQNEGQPMPEGEGIMWMPPDPARLEVLRCWIAGGAPNN